MKLEGTPRRQFAGPLEILKSVNGPAWCPSRAWARLWRSPFEKDGACSAVSEIGAAPVVSDTSGIHQMQSVTESCLNEPVV